MVVSGRVSWFRLEKKFGFVELDDGTGDAFLHFSVLKAAGYVTVPAGSKVRARVENQGDRRRVVEVLSIDTSTALASEPAPVRSKKAD
ncbi:cold shock domain-containing protein [Bradyrhizobium sp. IC3195]|uniref:cold-shock protein n=1 Tax=Bradyrhizobium sp. IC3195 TaxID=2793804 RepID=UPI001CD1D67C|nr:cold shock domain-containing protein [Bradyrhizobium sp. IC3195]MCA1470033.1 cold shock domain-containing protein [Bradyrhizobium sp. IC3195]